MNRREFHRSLLALSGAAFFTKFGRAQKTATPFPQSPTIVDTHAHIFERGLPLAANSRYVPTYDARLPDYLAQLDAHGTTHGVLVQPSFLGTDNRYLLAALKQQPHRLRGIVVVEPTITAGELAAMAAAGVVGIRLNLVGLPLPDLKHAPWPEFLERLRQLRWQVEVQREARDLPLILPLLLEAGVNIVIDHFGRPDPKLGIEDLGFRYLLSVASSRRVWVKLSGAYRNGAQGVGDAIARAAVPLLRKNFGTSRLLWGSDWPHTQFKSTINYGIVRHQFDEWITDPVERTAILQTTPCSLFSF
jgi:predicted TIM-barrel fold metal-dependent hydrolase